MGASCTSVCKTNRKSEVAEQSFSDVIFKIDLSEQTQPRTLDFKVIDGNVLELIEHCLGQSGDPRQPTLLRDITFLSRLDAEVVNRHCKEWLATQNFQDPRVQCHKLHLLEMLDELAGLNFNNNDLQFHQKNLREIIPLNQVASCIRNILTAQNYSPSQEERPALDPHKDEELNTFVESYFVFNEKDSLLAENSLLFDILLQYPQLERQYELIYYIIRNPLVEKKHFPLTQAIMLKAVENVLFQVLNYLKVYLKYSEQVDQDLIDARTIEELLDEKQEELDNSFNSCDLSEDGELGVISDTFSQMNQWRRRQSYDKGATVAIDNNHKLSEGLDHLVKQYSKEKLVHKISEQEQPKDEQCTDFEKTKIIDHDKDDDCSNVENETINGDTD